MASPEIRSTRAPVASTLHPAYFAMVMACLLYTSDAADERSSVDLGGRRIIKKKQTLYDETASRRS